MNSLFLIVLSLTACIAPPPPNPGNPTCDLALAASLRVDCGTVSTTPEQCASSGCCWNVVPVGPNCFRKTVANSNANNGDRCIPGLAASLRIDCGTASTTSGQCIDAGCCWEAIAVGANCYRQSNVALTNNGKCEIDLDKRVDCGTASTTPAQCADKGCCWNVISSGAEHVGPNCYFSK